MSRAPAALLALAVGLALAACRGEPGQAPAASPAAPSAATPPAAPVTDLDRLAAQPARAADEPDWGEPDMPKVRRLFQSRFAEVKRCYEAALQTNQAARGKLTLRFTIAESGALRDVAVARTTFKDRDVPACVAEVVRRWRTPFRPAEPVDVEYPFSFSPR